MEQVQVMVKTNIVEQAADWLRKGAGPKFIGRSQREILLMLLGEEEGEGIAQTVLDLAHRIATMPRTHETQGDHIAHLHYFIGGMDAWISEKDIGNDPSIPTPDADVEQPQAFGKARLNPAWDADPGYISIQEYLKYNIEIDLDWTPKPLSECGKN